MVLIFIAYALTAVLIVWAIAVAIGVQCGCLRALDDYGPTDEQWDRAEKAVRAGNSKELNDYIDSKGGLRPR